MQEFSCRSFQKNKISSGNFLVVSEQAQDWTFAGISSLPVIHSLPYDAHLEKLRNI